MRVLFVIQLIQVQNTGLATFTTEFQTGFFRLKIFFYYSFICENTKSIKERLLLCAQLFEAISHLEKMKMTHRDIKPDNIFLKKENGINRLYLADFGCSIDKFIFKNEPG